MNGRQEVISLALRIFGLVLAIGFWTGCVTEGHAFSSDTSWIQPGKTTRADVQLLLKEPYRVGSSSGSPTWTYGYYDYHLIGRSKQKELEFYWNPDGTVASYSFNSSYPADVAIQSESAKASQLGH